ncbi:hypothetical protein KILIM_010_00300 [Kineosphaera limosa NBRC 100340]|uniref:Uncharacterized protein n=2 Tax=Kineosphaera TaxID=211469 RepID=K6X7B7_9MICO|nr:hypothetical protein KILIM_010_00300 [Kineosphaera limosa NBRC 100340]
MTSRPADGVTEADMEEMRRRYRECFDFDSTEYQLTHIHSTQLIERNRLDEVSRGVEDQGRRLIGVEHRLERIEGLLSELVRLMRPAQARRGEGDAQD